jgi:hypothetical protein
MFVGGQLSVKRISHTDGLKLRARAREGLNQYVHQIPRMLVKTRRYAANGEPFNLSGHLSAFPGGGSDTPVRLLPAFRSHRDY